MRNTADPQNVNVENIRGAGDTVVPSITKDPKVSTEQNTAAAASTDSVKCKDSADKAVQGELANSWQSANKTDLRMSVRVSNITVSHKQVTWY